MPSALLVEAEPVALECDGGAEGVFVEAFVHAAAQVVAELFIACLRVGTLVAFGDAWQSHDAGCVAVDLDGEFVVAHMICRFSLDNFRLS